MPRSGTRGNAATASCGRSRDTMHGSGPTYLVQSPTRPSCITDNKYLVLIRDGALHPTLTCRKMLSLMQQDARAQGASMQPVTQGQEYPPTPE